MLKPTILVLTAVSALCLALPAATMSAVGATCLRCGPSSTPPPASTPPPPNTPDPGQNPNNKPADETGVSGGTTHENQMLIACHVPPGADSTTDLAFRNIGDKTIPQGTRVLWQVKATGQSGQFVLTADLDPGKELTAAALLKLGVPAKTSCLSKLP